MTSLARLRMRHGSAALEAGLVGGAGVVDQLARFTLAVIAAGVLGPVVFGAWALVTTIIQYANVLSLGVATGAARSIPVARGSGDDVAVERIEGAARAAGAATSILAGAVVGVLVAALLSLPGLWVPLLAAGAVAVQQQVVLDQSLMRSRFSFHRAGAEALTQGLLGLVLGILLLPLSIAGLLLARILAGLAALAVGWPARDRFARPVWDRGLTADLVRHGLPLVAAATMFGLLFTLDRWLVLVWYGDEALGQFSLASTVLAGLLMIPTLVSQQHLARTAFRFGQDSDRAGLAARARRQGAIAAAITAVGAVVVVVGAAFAIPRWLPEYQPALAPMAIGAVGAVLYAVTSGFPNVLGIQRKGRRLLAVQVAAVALQLLLAMAAFRAGLGLPGIALATATALTAYGLACVFSVWSSTRPAAE